MNTGISQPATQSKFFEDRHPLAKTIRPNEDEELTPSPALNERPLPHRTVSKIPCVLPAYTELTSNEHRTFYTFTPTSQQEHKPYQLRAWFRSAQDFLTVAQHSSPIRGVIELSKGYFLTWTDRTVGLWLYSVDTKTVSSLSKHKLYDDTCEIISTVQHVNWNKKNPFDFIITMNNGEQFTYESITAVCPHLQIKTSA